MNPNNFSTALDEHMIRNAPGVSFDNRAKVCIACSTTSMYSGLINSLHRDSIIPYCIAYVLDLGKISNM